MRIGRLKTTEGERSLPIPRIAKVGLVCETIDRDEERDGKQREIVKKTNTRRLRVYYLYTMPNM